MSRSAARMLTHLRSEGDRFVVFCDDLSLSHDDDINSGEAFDEKVSPSNPFGLWLGFYPCDQDAFFAMVYGYCATYELIFQQSKCAAKP